MEDLLPYLPYIIIVIIAVVLVLPVLLWILAKGVIILAVIIGIIWLLGHDDK